MPPRKARPVAVFSILGLCTFFWIRLYYLIISYRLSSKFDVQADVLRKLKIGFFPAYAFHEPVSWITSMFYHVGFWHLFSNMVPFLIFGPNLERALGWVRFLVLFFVAGTVGNLATILLNRSSTISHMGASGAVMGIITFAILHSIYIDRNRLESRSWGKLRLYWPYAVTFIFFVLPDFLMLLVEKEKSGGVSYSDHVGGVIGAWLYFDWLFGAEKRATRAAKAAPAPTPAPRQQTRRPHR